MTPLVPAVLPRFEIPKVSAEGFAAEIVTVAEEPLIDCDSVTLFPPARRNCAFEPLMVPVVPDVLPRFEIPKVLVPAAPPAPAEMVTVAEPADVDCESVMLLPPANRI